MFQLQEAEYEKLPVFLGYFVVLVFFRKIFFRIKSIAHCPLLKFKKIFRILFIHLSFIYFSLSFAITFLRLSHTNVSTVGYSYQKYREESKEFISEKNIFFSFNFFFLLYLHCCYLFVVILFKL